MTALPDFIQYNKFPGTPLNQIFSAASDDVLEVLDKMLTLNPSGRCTASRVKKAPFLCDSVFRQFH